MSMCLSQLISHGIRAKHCPLFLLVSSSQTPSPHTLVSPPCSPPWTAHEVCCPPRWICNDLSRSGPPTSGNREHAGLGVTHLCTPSCWHTTGRQQAWEGGRQGGKEEGRKGYSFLFTLVQPVGDSQGQSSFVLVSSTPVSPSGKRSFSQSPSRPLPFSVRSYPLYCEHLLLSVLPYLRLSYLLLLTEMPLPGGQASLFCALLYPQHLELRLSPSKYSISTFGTDE